VSTLSNDKMTSNKEAYRIIKARFVLKTVDSEARVFGKLVAVLV
jgi:hypothetical protein